VQKEASKILKSGCKAEASKLRTANRLVNLISVFAILSWCIFWITMMNRAAPKAGPEVAFTALEIKLLDRLVSDKLGTGARRRSLSVYLTKLARLGGHLARANDPPPGNMVVWRGLSRLTDMVFCTRASSEFRHVSGEPSAACNRCSSSEWSHSSSACGSRFEITPTSFIAIISTSAAHRGHHARTELRPRRISKESVSMVIFVCFAMETCFPRDWA
jgi:hypothetical protein